MHSLLKNASFDMQVYIELQLHTISHRMQHSNFFQDVKEQ